VNTANGASVIGPLTSVAVKGLKSGSRTPVGEEWELDCEICQRRGVNLVSIYRFMIALPN